MTIQLGSANADASAFDLDDVLYKFSGFPRIVATRDSAGTTISVTEISSSPYSNFRLYIANDHRSTFTVRSNSTTLPYTDGSDVWNLCVEVFDTSTETWNINISGLDASLNYKYKATYVATGTKDGNTYVAQSQASRPVYTVGNKRI